MNKLYNYMLKASRGEELHPIPPTNFSLHDFLLLMKDENVKVNQDLGLIVFNNHWFDFRPEFWQERPDGNTNYDKWYCLYVFGKIENAQYLRGLYKPKWEG